MMFSMAYMCMYLHRLSNNEYGIVQFVRIIVNISFQVTMKVIKITSKTLARVNDNMTALDKDMFLNACIIYCLN